MCVWAARAHRFSTPRHVTAFGTPGGRSRSENVPRLKILKFPCLTQRWKAKAPNYLSVKLISWCMFDHRQLKTTKLPDAGFVSFSGSFWHTGSGGLTESRKVQTLSGYWVGVWAMAALVPPNSSHTSLPNTPSLHPCCDVIHWANIQLWRLSHMSQVTQRVKAEACPKSMLLWHHYESSLLSEAALGGRTASTCVLEGSLWSQYTTKQNYFKDQSASF